MILEGLLGSVIVPAVIDMVKSAGMAISRKWFGMSVDDQIKLQNADVEKLKALAQLDNPYGTPSQWVVNLRASFRYIAAMVVIVVGAISAWVGIETLNEEVIETGFTLVGIPFAFIFGERLYLGLKGKK